MNHMHRVTPEERVVVSDDGTSGLCRAIRHEQKVALWEKGLIRKCRSPRPTMDDHCAGIFVKAKVSMLLRRDLYFLRCVVESIYSKESLLGVGEIFAKPFVGYDSDMVGEANMQVVANVLVSSIDGIGARPKKV